MLGRTTFSGSSATAWPAFTMGWSTFGTWPNPTWRTSGTMSTTELATYGSLSPKTTPGARSSLSLSGNAAVEAQRTDEPRDSLPCWAIPTIAVACAASLNMILHVGALVIKSVSGYIFSQQHC